MVFQAIGNLVYSDVVEKIKKSAHMEKVGPAFGPRFLPSFISLFLFIRSVN